MEILTDKDLFIRICYEFRTTKQLVLLEQLSKFHLKLIRKEKWPNFVVSIRSNYMLEQMQKTHSFGDLGFLYDNDKISSIDFSRLQNCHFIGLLSGGVTDKIVLKIKNCPQLGLAHNSSVTDKSVSELGNCQLLNLAHTRITDVSVLKLTKCQILNLSYTKVTDASVSTLINCKKIYLKGTAVSAECIDKLKKTGCTVILDTY